MLKLKLPSISLKRLVLSGLPLLILSVYFYTNEFDQLVQSHREAWEQDLVADCAVVLTGGAGRVKEGLDLLARQQVQRLVVAGVNPQSRLRDLFPQLAMYPQIREENIVLEHFSATTFGNAQQSLPIVEALQCREILLVTSYLHMRRALKTFTAAYPSEIKIIPYGIAGNDLPPTFWDLFMEATKSLFYAVWAY